MFKRQYPRRSAKFFEKQYIKDVHCDYDFEDPFDIQIFRNKIYEVTNLIEQNQGAENPHHLS